jgi:hypothetical protein
MPDPKTYVKTGRPLVPIKRKGGNKPKKAGLGNPDWPPGSLINSLGGGHMVYLVLENGSWAPIRPAQLGLAGNAGIDEIKEFLLKRGVKIAKVVY